MKTGNEGKLHFSGLRRVALIQRQGAIGRPSDSAVSIEKSEKNENDK
jgi:hypothetical protein